VTVARGYGWNGGYGQYVVVSHPNGTQTLYAHLSNVIVSQGTSVSQGQVIGYSGSSGRSTGAHLHFEVRGAKNPF
jgi:murein DD-endopeptidase MepM/ murein hydrolase activator NlpD